MPEGLRGLNESQMGYWWDQISPARGEVRWANENKPLETAALYACCGSVSIRKCGTALLEVATVDLNLRTERDHDAHGVRTAIVSCRDKRGALTQRGFKLSEHAFVLGRLDHVRQ